MPGWGQPAESSYIKLDTEIGLEILNTLRRMEKQLSDISADQAHLNEDVASLTTSLTAIEAEIASLKTANPAVDFTALDALVARATADVPAPAAPPAAPAV